MFTWYLKLCRNGKLWFAGPLIIATLGVMVCAFSILIGNFSLLRFANTILQVEVVHDGSPVQTLPVEDAMAPTDGDKAQVGYFYHFQWVLLSVIIGPVMYWLAVRLYQNEENVLDSLVGVISVRPQDNLTREEIDGCKLRLGEYFQSFETKMEPWFYFICLLIIGLYCWNSGRDYLTNLGFIQAHKYPAAYARDLSSQAPEMKVFVFLSIATQIICLLPLVHFGLWSISRLVAFSLLIPRPNENLSNIHKDEHQPVKVKLLGAPVNPLPMTAWDASLVLHRRMTKTERDILDRHGEARGQRGDRPLGETDDDDEDETETVFVRLLLDDDKRHFGLWGLTSTFDTIHYIGALLLLLMLSGRFGEILRSGGKLSVSPAAAEMAMAAGLLVTVLFSLPFMLCQGRVRRYRTLLRRRYERMSEMKAKLERNRIWPSGSASPVVMWVVFLSGLSLWAIDLMPQTRGRLDLWIYFNAAMLAVIALVFLLKKVRR